MKNFYFVLGILLSFAFFTDSAKAEEIWVNENGKLICYEKKEVHSAQPEELSAETAGKLIRGEIPEPIIKGDKKIELVLKSFWHLQEVEIISQTKVSYSDGAWVSKEILPQRQDKFSWRAFLTFMLVPALGVLIISIINQWCEVGDGRLFVFYGAILVPIIFANLSGCLNNETASMFIGGFIGIIAGVFAGGFACDFDRFNILIGGIGFFTSMFTGAIIGVVAGTFSIGKEYFVFFTFVCLFSFIMSKIILGIIRKLRPVRVLIV